MRDIAGAAFQGDMMLVRVDTLPKGLKREDSNVLAHSETGHHHVVVGGKGRLWREDAMTCYLQLTEPAEIVHQRPYDTHETLRLAPGVWKVRRQREWTPEGWRRVED